MKHCANGCGARHWRRKMPINWRAVWVGTYTDLSDYYLKFCSYVCEAQWWHERRGAFDVDVEPCDIQGWDEEMWLWVA